ncbi:MAG TPA: hypothetical protein DFS52_26995 [Myxococcales bacterium]|nr:hypothetical protein [Myxococcales bacterium]
MDDWVKPVDFTAKMRLGTANEFLLGVMLDRAILADKAWDSAEWICDSLGEPDAFWSNLVKMDRKALKGFMRYGYGGKSFHRYYKTFAELLPLAAEHILENYEGDPRRIWNSKRDVKAVRDELDAVPGIGQALANMAVLILARNYGLLGGKEALKELDIKPDIQVRRVFERSGLVIRPASDQALIDAAKKLAPDFPASLDAPAWEIGRTFCKPKVADCDNCPLGEVCPRL